jgi:hypothetical protein
MFAELIVGALAAYLAAGILFAAAFVIAGVDKVDPAARGATTGFRVLIVPGSALLWPLLARRWLAGASHPPAERNAHRNAARARS